jgi:hypothetical protein
VDKNENEIALKGLIQVDEIDPWTNWLLANTS